MKTIRVLSTEKPLNTPMPTEMVAKIVTLNKQPTGSRLQGLQTKLPLLQYFPVSRQPFNPVCL